MKTYDSKSAYISVVSPVYGCAECLLELCDRLRKALEPITPHYEILLVNDASPDDAWLVICELAKRDERIRGINLSRNFGQHYAITAGLDFSRGDWIVIMDCDLQDAPEELNKLYSAAQEGYDMVVGRRSERRDGWAKRTASKLFYKTYAYFTGSEIDHRIGSYGIYSRKVIESIRDIKEQARSFGLLALWVGFSRLEIDIHHAKRAHGNSSYNLSRMVNLAMDSIISHSNRLLYTTVKLGLLLSAASLGCAAWIAIRYVFYKTAVTGWTSLIVSIYFTTGLIIGCLGFVGLYVGKIFTEVKRRPLYVVRSKTF